MAELNGRVMTAQTIISTRQLWLRTPLPVTTYDPDGDGNALTSQGVHEHWNNATDKQYTRNLGTGNGIELVTDATAGLAGPHRRLVC